MNQKQRRYSIVKDWMTSMNKSVSANYTLDKNINVIGPELLKMTEKQLQTVNALICAAYNHGCDSTRKHIKELKRNNEAYDSTKDQEILESRQGLYLLAGGIK